METKFLPRYYIIFICSYPTYEEWKLSFIVILLLSTISSYPTYEEWKLSFIVILLLSTISSYPTYEEWKRQMSFV